MSRIGVFVCHCGENIARTVDARRSPRRSSDHPGVVHAEDYKYMCSDPGQALVQQGDRGARAHGRRRRRLLAAHAREDLPPRLRQAGLNPFICEMANIREHCSWIHEDKAEATPKAIDIARTIVEKVKHNRPLESIRIPVTKRALVIGGGIAGIQAALDIADGGHEVVLVEKEASIGGHMSQLSETFPTLDCSQCILTPRMVEAYQHPLHQAPHLERSRVGRRLHRQLHREGAQEGALRRRGPLQRLRRLPGGVPRQEDPQRVRGRPRQADGDLRALPAGRPQHPRARPRRTAPCSRGAARASPKDACGKCKEACLKNAIDYDAEDTFVEEEVGAIVVATGFDLYSIGREQPEGLKGYGEYGYGEVPDVIDGLQFERLASASGPTGGAILRPSDGKEPKTVVFVHCVGSRDPDKGMSYCSKICCMYNAKHAMLYKHKVHDGRAVAFYMDIRAAGKGYDEFSRRAIEEDEAEYVRGRVSRIFREGDVVKVWGFDTLSGEQIVIDADMVVLATAIRPQAGARELAQKLSVSYDEHGFFNEAHPKLRPVETNTAGVFLAGACQAPRDIPDSVAMASATAAKVASLFSADELEREPAVAVVNETTCIGCMQLPAGLRVWGDREARDPRPRRVGRARRRLREPGRVPGLRYLPGGVPEQEHRARDLHRRAGLRRDQRLGGLGVT